MYKTAEDIIALEDEKEFLDRSTHRFTFNWLANRVITRQHNDKDSIIIIIGDRGEGKSNWGLKLINAYIKLRIIEEKAIGKKYTWSWRDNFPLTRTSALDMGRNLFKSFICHDEGGDQFYTAETLKRAQRELVKFMNKDRAKLNMKLIIWPDPFTLDAKVINMGNLMVICPYRYRRICAWAFLYRKTGTVLSYDRFGILKIRKKLESPTKAPKFTQTPGISTMNIKYQNKVLAVSYPKNIFKFLKTIPSFAMVHRYSAVNKRFEDAYKKNVKDKQLEDQDADNYVPKVVHDGLNRKYGILLRNLVAKSEMSYAQLERLHIDPKDGVHLRSVPAMKRHINEIEATL